MRKIKRFWQEYTTCQQVEILVIMASIIISCMLFSYSDFRSLSAQNIEIWDALFSGRITEYFLVTAENLREAPHGGNSYGILYLIPWGIWNLPIWLTHSFNGNYDIFTPLCQLWSKLFLVMCAIVTAQFTKKIVEHFTQDKKLSAMAFILTLGSGSLIISVGYCGQDEITYVACLLVGFYYFLKEKWVLSSIYMGVAVILCPFILMPVLCVLLMREKNILKILVHLLCYVIPNVVVSHLCGGKDISWLAESSNYTMAPIFGLGTLLDWFFKRTVLPLGFGSVSIFAVFLVLIYANCYFTKYEKTREFEYKVLLYITMIIAMGICVLSWVHAYRYYIGVLFLIMTILIRGKEKNDVTVGIFLIMLLEYFHVFVSIESLYIFQYKTCTLNEIVITGHAVDGSIFTVLQTFFPAMDILVFIANSCYFALILCAIFYIGYEKRKSYDVQFPMCVSRGLYVGLPVIMLVAFFISWKFVIVRDYEIEANGQVTEAINGSISLYEEYIADGTSLKFIDINPVVNKKGYPDDEYLSIDIIDSHNGKIMQSNDVWANDLQDENFVRVPLNVDVIKGNKYLIRFYSKSFIQEETNWIYLKKPDDNISKNNELIGYIQDDIGMSTGRLFNVISKVCELNTG